MNGVFRLTCVLTWLALGASACGKSGGAESGASATPSAATSSTPPPPKPIAPPPEAQQDPDHLPWHLEEEAKAASEIDQKNYRSALATLEQELDAGPVK